MTTTAFYPDADPETTTVDGEVLRSSTPDTWSGLRDGAGNVANDTIVPAFVSLHAADAPDTDKWITLERGILLFDTSSIGSNTPTAATLNLFVTGHPDAFGGMSLDVVAVSPASNTALVTSDYGQFGTTLLGTINLSDLTDNAYNAITLNADGLAAIATGGITKLGLRLSADRTNTPPTWSDGAFTSVAFRTAEQSGTGTDPYLEVTYSLLGTAGQGLIDLTPIAATAKHDAAGGVGAVDVTPVAPTVDHRAAVLQELIKVRSVAPGASSYADVPEQPIDIRSVTPGVSRSWTSPDPTPLELTAIAPTVRFSAAAGVGKVKVTATQMVAAEAAGLSGIGHVGFAPVQATGKHSAAAGVGLVDVTGVPGNSRYAVVSGQGKLAIHAVSPATTKVAASGRGFIDVTHVAATGKHSAAAGIGLIDITYVAAATTKAAPSGLGRLALVRGLATVNFAVASGIGSIDVSAVSPATTKVTTHAVCSVHFAGVAASASFSVTAGQGLIDVSPVAATAKHDAANGPGLIDLTLPNVGSDHAIAAGMGLIDLTPVAAGALRPAAAGLGLIDLTAVAPGTTKPAAAGIGSIDLTPIAATGKHTALMSAQAWHLTPVAPVGTFRAVAGLAECSFAIGQFTAAKDVPLESVEIAVFGLAPREPYGPVYSTACTLAREGLSCEFIVRGT